MEPETIHFPALDVNEVTKAVLHRRHGPLQRQFAEVAGRQRMSSLSTSSKSNATNNDHSRRNNNRLKLAVPSGSRQPISPASTVECACTACVISLCELRQRLEHVPVGETSSQ